MEKFGRIQIGRGPHDEASLIAGLEGLVGTGHYEPEDRIIRIFPQNITGSNNVETSGAINHPDDAIDGN